MRLGSWFPVLYQLPPRERGYEQEIIVNWLQVEVDEDMPKRLPILDRLRGWRNREVYYYIQGWDWTERMYR